MNRRIVAPHVATLITEHAHGDERIASELVDTLTDQQLQGRAFLPDPLPATAALISAVPLDGMTRAERRLLLIATLSVTDSTATLLSAAAVDIDAILSEGTPSLRFSDGRFRVVDGRMRSVLASTATPEDLAEAHWALAHAHRAGDRRIIAAWHTSQHDPQGREIDGAHLLALAENRAVYGDFPAAFEIARLASQRLNGSGRIRAALFSARAAIWCGYQADAEEHLAYAVVRGVGEFAGEARKLRSALDMLRDGPDDDVVGVEARTLATMHPVVEVAMTKTERTAMQSLNEIIAGLQRFDYEEADAQYARLLLGAVPAQPRWPWSAAPGPLSPLAEANVRLLQTAFHLQAHDLPGATPALYDAVERLPLVAAGAGVVADFIRLVPQPDPAAAEKLATTFDALAPRRRVRFEYFTVPTGDSSVAASMIASPPAEARPSRQPWTELLSPREHEVAEMVAMGNSNNQIAGELTLSVRTVEVHLGRVFRKLGLHSRTELVAHVLRAR